MTITQDITHVKTKMLRKNTYYSYITDDKLQKLGFSLGPEPSPIVAVRLNDKAEALAIWSGLLEQGVYVNLVFPPATPDGNCLLRSSVSAGHTPPQMEHICSAFTSVRELTAMSQAV